MLRSRRTPLRGPPLTIYVLLVCTSVARRRLSEARRSPMGVALLNVVDIALALENITVTFTARNAGARPYTAVRDTTLVIGRGEFVSVVGPTGCGKSTLLNIGAGLLPPSAGRV